MLLYAVVVVVVVLLLIIYNVFVVVVYNTTHCTAGFLPKTQKKKNKTQTERLTHTPCCVLCVYYYLYGTSMDREPALSLFS